MSRALTGLDLVAEPGQVTALLGPNGAGKTSFISAVATLLRPDSGELRVAGIDARSEPRRVRRLIGLAGQSASVEPAMAGWETWSSSAASSASTAAARGQPREPSWRHWT